MVAGSNPVSPTGIKMTDAVALGLLCGGVALGVLLLVLWLRRREDPSDGGCSGLDTFADLMGDVVDWFDD